MDRIQIIRALDAFLKSRPGFDPANYTGAAQAYRADARTALQHLHDARFLLSAVLWRDSIDAKALIEAKHHRIEFRPSKDGKSVKVDYCTGSYYPTEYRAAVCATLASALWNYFRVHHDAKTADDVREMARLEFGRSLARRWFN